jgi:hypothetical protein
VNLNQRLRFTSLAVLIWVFTGMAGYGWFVSIIVVVSSITFIVTSEKELNKED